jgi:hypothetical protein
MDIVRKELSADELTTPGTRYNPDTDTVQVLVNGTWVDSAAADPRTSPAFLYPPLTTSDPACDASANMVAGIRNLVSEAVSTGSLVAMASLIYQAIAAVFPPLLIFDPLVLVICDVIIGLTTTVVNGAFTDGVYADILCYFKDVVDSDGQLDAAGLESVRTQITDHQDAVVAAVCDAIFALVGWVGVNNWGSSGTETGDCSTCDQWCYTFDFTIDAQGWNNLSGQAVYTSGVGWQTINYTGGPSYRYLAIGITAAMDLVSYDIVFSYTAGILNNTGDNTFVAANAGFGSPTLHAISIATGTPTSPQLWTGTATLSALNVLFLCGAQFGGGHDPGGQVTVTHITLHGTGTNPFGTDNC